MNRGCTHHIHHLRLEQEAPCVPSASHEELTVCHQDGAPRPSRVFVIRVRVNVQQTILPLLYRCRSDIGVYVLVVKRHEGLDPLNLESMVHTPQSPPC